LFIILMLYLLILILFSCSTQNGVSVFQNGVLFLPHSQTIVPKQKKACHSFTLSADLSMLL
ncbi:MAG: hypothetical protein MSS99_01610, partial [Bacteroidales bacterium]|nr:hypothetical protein [Bacteroidales bacterium]